MIDNYDDSFHDMLGEFLLEVLEVWENKLFEHRKDLNERIEWLKRMTEKACQLLKMISKKKLNE